MPLIEKLALGNCPPGSKRTTKLSALDFYTQLKSATEQEKEQLRQVGESVLRTTTDPEIAYSAHKLRTYPTKPNLAELQHKILKKHPSKHPVKRKIMRRLKQVAEGEVSVSQAEREGLV